MSSRARILQWDRDFWRTYPGSPAFWTAVREDLNGHPARHPRPEAICKALASGRPVPPWAADYIAGRLAGSIKLPRGAPQWSMIGLTVGEEVQLPQSPVCKENEKIRHWLLGREVHLRKLLFKLGEQDRGDSPIPYEEAATYLSERTGISVDEIFKCSASSIFEVLAEEAKRCRRRSKYSGPYDMALAAASKHSGIPEDTLSNYRYPRRGQ